MEENFQENQPKSKRKVGKAIGILVVLIIIALLLVGGIYYYQTTRANYIFLQETNSLIDNIANVEEYNTLNSTVSLSVNIDSTSSTSSDNSYEEIYNFLNASKLTVNTQIDNENKSAYLGLDIDYNSSNLIAGNVYYKEGENNVYVYLEDIFDRYFRIDISEYLTELNSLQQNNMYTLSENADIDNLKEIIKSEIANQLTEDRFTTENVDVTINNQTVSTRKSSLRLTITELRNILMNIFGNLESNQEFLSCFANPNNIVQLLQELTVSLNEPTDFENTVIGIDIYTKGLFPEIVKTDLVIDVPNEGVVTFNINKIDENNCEFFAEMEVDTNGIQATVQALSGTYKKEVVDENTESIEFVVNIPDLGNVTINIEKSVIKNEPIQSVDTTNSVDIENISETDQATIMQNMQNHPLFQLVQSIYSSAQSTYETNESYDGYYDNYYDDYNDASYDSNDNSDYYNSYDDEYDYYNSYDGYESTYNEYNNSYSTSYNETYSSEYNTYNTMIDSYSNSTSANTTPQNPVTNNYSY